MIPSLFRRHVSSPRTHCRKLLYCKLLCINFSSHTPNLLNVEIPIHNGSTSISIAKSLSILDRGAVPGPFNVFRKRIPALDEYNPTTSKLISKIASGYSFDLINNFRQVCTPEIYNETREYREAIFQQLPFERDVLAHRRLAAALWVIVTLHRQDPVRLCRLLPSLYVHHGLTRHNFTLAIKYLFYHFLEQSLQSVQIPAEFYEALLHPNVTHLQRNLFIILPRYSLLQKCPERLQSSVETSLSNALGNSSHWEDKLLEAQSLAFQGHFEHAIQVVSTISNDPRWTVEFVNTLYSILDSADGGQIGEERASSIVSKVTNLNLNNRQHPHIWIRLIDFAQNAKSTSSLELIARSVEHSQYVGVRVLIRLVEAMDQLKCKPLDPFTHSAADHWARKNFYFATTLLHTWRNYLKSTTLRNKDSVSSSIYSHLTPIYRRYFHISVLNALSLPCQPDRTVNALKKHNENGYAVAIMMHTYLGDHRWDLQVTLNNYRRFRELLAMKHQVMAGLDDSSIACLYMAFLSSIARSHEKMLDLCISIVAEIIDITNSISSKPSSASQTTKSVMNSVSPPMSHQLSHVTSHTWLTLLKAFTRHAQFDAAEKVMDEIRRHHPHCFNRGSEILLEALTKADHSKEAHKVLISRQASGVQTSRELNGYVLSFNAIRAEARRRSAAMRAKAKEMDTKQVIIERRS